jgi:DNA polymerase II
VTERFEGTIVHASWDTGHSGTRVFFVGRLLSGETFAVVLTRVRPSFYLRESDVRRARETIEHGSIESTDRRTIDGEAVHLVSFAEVSPMQRAAESLKRARIRCYESDLRVYDRILIDSGITGPVAITGSSSPGRRVDRVFVDPELAEIETIAGLSIASIDIENDPQSEEILSVAIAWSDAKTGEASAARTFDSEVLYTGRFEGGAPPPEWVVPVENEAELLERFCRRLREVDPDIVTGWNVVEYDFRMIARRLEHHRIAFDVGRSERAGAYLSGEEGQSSAVVIPGRQVVDAMRVMRSSQDRFFDHRLETVARSVLGEGKVDLGGPKLEAILTSYRNAPREFCEYNRRDAELVLEILEKSGMLDLSIRRAMLTGLPLSKAWTSVAAFENLYLAAMHRRSIVAPDHGTDSFPVGRAPGGAIIPPSPGVFTEVLVFDFKSLYPSIMRTFNIDPVAFIPPERLDAGNDVIEAPNGAAFRRHGALLPAILESFAERREDAKRANDPAASYVYKIIMNSFYGVLGTPGCRFAATDIAGAITSFGHDFLSWCRRHFEAAGYDVLYGDTDSLFIRVPEAGADPEELLATGRRIAEETTGHVAEYVETRWKVRSRLELQFECLYRRFFLPALRGMSGTSAIREVEVAALQGRAKGYAGQRYVPTEPGGPWKIDIKGMEAVRRDWTEAAKRLQRELLALVFEDSTIERLEATIRSHIADMKRGALDDDLVYHKALRKSADSYTRSKPAHVRAASMLPASERHGVISYVWTVNGPEPVSLRRSPPDYDHYLEKQLKPVAEGIGDVLGTNFARLFRDDPQRELFA